MKNGIYVKRISKFTSRDLDRYDQGEDIILVSKYENTILEQKNETGIGK